VLLRIKFLRLTHGFSQKQVAKKVGVPRAYISHLENGWRNPCDRERTALARVLGCTPEQLLEPVSDR
jgi:transcriptional regulator with XRE-family HTH domain